MEALQIDISATRALTVTGRLVAGETAQVTISGAMPTALYLVAPDQTVVAACEAFTPTDEGSGGVGFLQLATEQVAALFAHTPAGRMVAVWALVNDANGVAGAGWIPVVSAPMPDELIDLDIDFYLRASQIGAGLAIVDGKLVCTVNPDTYLTKTEAAQTYATQTALAGKYTKPATGIPATDLAAAVQTSLGKADTALQSAPVQSVNGQTGEVSITGADVPTVEGSAVSVADALTGFSAVLQDLSNALSSKADTASLRYALGEVLAPDASGAVTLADRAVNFVLLTSTIATLTLNFPDAVSGHMRDFLVVIAAKADVTAPEIALPNGVVAANADGAIPAIATTTEVGDTAVTLLCFSEVLADYFFVKGEGMKAVANE